MDLMLSLDIMSALIFGGWAANMKKQTGTLFWMILLVSVNFFTGDTIGVLLLFMGFFLEDVCPIFKENAPLTTTS